MPPFVRIVLWSLAVVVPGGVLLVPVLLGDALRRRAERRRVGPSDGPDPVEAEPQSRAAA